MKADWDNVCSMEHRLELLSAHLDKLYVPAGNHITMERNAYNAAVEVLKIAGFDISTIEKGNRCKHIVY